MAAPANWNLELHVYEETPFSIILVIDIVPVYLFFSRDFDVDTNCANLLVPAPVSAQSYAFLECLKDAGRIVAGT